MNNWQDISTAPRDGSRVLTYTPQGCESDAANCKSGFHVCSLNRVYQFHLGKLMEAAWVIGYGDSSGGEYDSEPIYCIPTHWIALPKPPKEKS